MDAMQKIAFHPPFREDGREWQTRIRGLHLKVVCAVIVHGLALAGFLGTNIWPRPGTAGVEAGIPS